MGRKILQYLESCLYVNLITFFAIIEDLFNYLKDNFDNFYQKKHVLKKFRNLKIDISSFNDFYFEFIRLASDLKYMSKILIWKFKYKLIPHF